MDKLAQSIRIRPQNQAGDLAEIPGLNGLAFGKGGGTAAFQALREAADPDIVSLVAEHDGALVGHVFFSPVTIETDPPLAGMGLGELAVRPDLQRQGIGAALTEAGLARLTALGYPFCIVIGVPEYYPRLGFEPGADHGLRCQWEVPAASFMVRILDPAGMAGVSGVARYRDV